jgi:hypothetical protein
VAGQFLKVLRKWKFLEEDAWGSVQMHVACNIDNHSDCIFISNYKAVTS